MQRRQNAARLQSVTRQKAAMFALCQLKIALATKVESQVISLVFTQALVTSFSLQNCANSIQLCFTGHFKSYSKIWRKV
jgi:CBS domain containing-hemolysin-like protein